MEQPLTMSVKEREKLKVMHELEKGQMSRREAAECLELSERHIYRLYARYRQDGDEALIHGLRGTHSNRGYPLKVRSACVELFTKRYADYGPTLLSEVLASEHDLFVAPETLRRWLLAKHLWELHRKARPHRKRRERRNQIGSLIQFDGSEHDWFERRGPRCTLLVAIDDASGRVMLRFAPCESTQTVLSFWKDYVQRHGIPKEIYTDYGSVYAANGDSADKLTDFGLAMKQLGIHHVFAHSPQAKGRVERSNRTLQDRLGKALRRKQISSIADANQYVERTFCREYNHRFAHLGEGIEDVHRPCVYTEPELKNIFCFSLPRTVYNDSTITLGAQFIQLDASKAPVPPPRNKVTVRKYLDGSLHVFWQENELGFTVLENKPKPKSPKFLPGYEEHPWRRKRILIGKARQRARNMR